MSLPCLLISIMRSRHMGLCSAAGIDWKASANSLPALSHSFNEQYWAIMDTYICCKSTVKSGTEDEEEEVEEEVEVV